DLFQGLLGVKDSADDVFAATIVRMCLAGEDDLELPAGLGDLPQTIQVRKNQIRALVARGASRETNGERFRVQTEAGLLAHRFEEFVFRDEMRGPDLLRRKTQRAAQAVIVFAPGRDTA